MTMNTTNSKRAGKITKFNYMLILQIMSVHFQSHRHLFNVSITSVQDLLNVKQKVRKELITQSRCHLFKTCWEKWQSRCCLFKTCRKNDSVQLNDKIIIHFSKKCPNTSKTSHVHLQCVHNNCAKFEESQFKGVRGVDCRLFKTWWKND
jgi:hypothetical protein